MAFRRVYKSWEKSVKGMKVEFTNEDEIKYLEVLVQDDIKRLKKKVDVREKVWSTIKFAQELGDF